MQVVVGKGHTNRHKKSPTGAGLLKTSKQNLIMKGEARAKTLNDYWVRS